MSNGKQGADAGWAVFAKLGGVKLLDFLHVAAPSVVGEMKEVTVFHTVWILAGTVRWIWDWMGMGLGWIAFLQ